MTAQQQAEEHLRRALTDLPVTAQLLLAAAAHLTCTHPDAALTPSALGRAFAAAGAAVLAPYPDVVRAAALDRLTTALADHDAGAPITNGEYALWLRAAAGRTR